MKLGPLQRKWVETLKKYPHRQTTKVLGERKKNGHIKACCLGQALLCLLEHKGEELPVGELTSGGPSIRSELSEHYEELGLYDDVGQIYGSDDCLAEMNDHGRTWKEIAEFIESNPEKVFTKSV